MYDQQIDSFVAEVRQAVHDKLVQQIESKLVEDIRPKLKQLAEAAAKDIAIKVGSWHNYQHFRQELHIVINDKEI